MLTKSLLAFPWLPMETTGLSPQKRVYSGAREKQKILRNCLRWWSQRTDFLHWLRCKPDREQSELNFCKGYQPFRLLRCALARFCFRPVDIRLPSCPPIRHIIFSFFTCTHHGSEEGYFGRDGTAKREGSRQTHLAGERWESIWIPDIAGVDYLAGHQGRTKFEPLEELSVFVDDFYVYGLLLKP